MFHFIFLQILYFEYYVKNLIIYFVFWYSNNWAEKIVKRHSCLWCTTCYNLINPSNHSSMLRISHNCDEYYEKTNCWWIEILGRQKYKIIQNFICQTFSRQIIGTQNKAFFSISNNDLYRLTFEQLQLSRSRSVTVLYKFACLHPQVVSGVNLSSWL